MARGTKGYTNNPNGRPIGSKNQKTIQWETFSQYMMKEGLEKFQIELMKLKGRDYVSSILQLMEFFKPKYQRTELTGVDGAPIRKEIIIKLLDGDKPKQKTT